jgi:L-ascorbate metabolism protein UlaG (beta-lactamase superfamily)
LRVTWLGHSSVLLEIDGARILTDPVWSNRISPVAWAGPKRFFAPPLPLDELPELDVVVISHDHYDHLDRDTIEYLAQKGPVFAVPLGVGEYLEQWGVAPSRILEADWWEKFEVGSLRLTATPARHSSGRSLVRRDKDKTLWSGWAIEGPSHRVYFSGDTSLFPGFREIGSRLGPFDVTLLETGAYDELWPDNHMGPEQAVVAHTMLRGRLLIPIHWGTFDLGYHSWVEPAERTLVAASEVSVPVVIPRPGESVEPGNLPYPASARWWPDIPWQSAAESPIKSTGLGPSDVWDNRAVPESTRSR